jgi:hypothetical protein
MFSIEKEVAKYFPVESSLSHGVEGLTRQVALENRFPIPKIFVFKDPVPNAVLARGLFGNGTLLLSRGLIESYSEAEFCLILERLMTRLNGRGTRIKTFFSLIAAKWVSLMPEKWVGFFWEIPNKKNPHRLDFFSGIYSVMLLSLSTMSLYVGQILSRIIGLGVRKTTRVEEIKFSAVDFPVLTGNPGIGPLYMVDPWADRFFWS